MDVFVWRFLDLFGGPDWDRTVLGIIPTLGVLLGVSLAMWCFGALFGKNDHGDMVPAFFFMDLGTIQKGFGEVTCGCVDWCVLHECAAAGGFDLVVRALLHLLNVIRLDFFGNWTHSALF
jgi:hypothetical protein